MTPYWDTEGRRQAVYGLVLVPRSSVHGQHDDRLLVHRDAFFFEQRVVKRCSDFIAFYSEVVSGGVLHQLFDSRGFRPFNGSCHHAQSLAGHLAENAAGRPASQGFDLVTCAYLVSAYFVKEGLGFGVNFGHVVFDKFLQHRDLLLLQAGCFIEAYERSSGR